MFNRLIASSLCFLAWYSPAISIATDKGSIQLPECAKTFDPNRAELSFNGMFAGANPQIIPVGSEPFTVPKHPREISDLPEAENVVAKIAQLRVQKLAWSLSDPAKLISGFYRDGGLRCTFPECSLRINFGFSEILQSLILSDPEKFNPILRFAGYKLIEIAEKHASRELARDFTDLEETIGRTFKTHLSSTYAEILAELDKVEFKNISFADGSHASPRQIMLLNPSDNSPWNRVAAILEDRFSVRLAFMKKADSVSHSYVITYEPNDLETDRRPILVISPLIFQEIYKGSEYENQKTEDFMDVLVPHLFGHFIHDSSFQLDSVEMIDSFIDPILRAKVERGTRYLVEAAVLMKRMKKRQDSGINNDEIAEDQNQKDDWVRLRTIGMLLNRWTESFKEFIEKPAEDRKIEIFKAFARLMNPDDPPERTASIKSAIKQYSDFFWTQSALYAHAVETDVTIRSQVGPKNTADVTLKMIYFFLKKQFGNHPEISQLVELLDPDTIGP